MNSWSFTGNIGSDAEIRHTSAGAQLCQFTVATTSGYGEKKSTTWARCTLFGKRSESLAPYLLKGQQVGVVGEVKLHEWTGKDGITKQSLEVHVQDVTLLGSKADKREPAKQMREEPAGMVDDDIPFSNYEYRTLA